MDRLTAQDLSMVWPDDVGWPQDIGALAILDGTRLFDPEGRFRIEAVRAAIEARLHLVPRFRQLLYLPRRGLGWPLWVDDPAFEIRDHVTVVPLPAPGDEAQLLLATESLRRRRLARTRPLWQMWFLTGLPAGQVGFYMKVHHTIADGAAGVATLGAFLDAVPGDAPVVPPRPWTPAPAPSAWDLLEDNLQRRMDGLRRSISAVAHPMTTARQVREGWPAVRETLADTRAPRTSFNRPIVPDRRLALVRSGIELVKQVGHAHEATVNDVLMTVLASGLRDLLRARAEDLNDLVLRAYVPVSLHREPGAARGNRDGVMAVPLPIGIPDPIQRLRVIAAETAERKKRKRPPAGTLLRSGITQRAFMRLMARQRWANVYVANVRGPSQPLCLAGAPLLEVFPIVPLTGNVALGVGALSYAGQFNITVVADADAVPDVDTFATGMREALHMLFASRSVKRATAGISSE